MAWPLSNSRMSAAVVATCATSTGRILRQKVESATASTRLPTRHRHRCQRLQRHRHHPLLKPHRQEHLRRERSRLSLRGRWLQNAKSAATVRRLSSEKFYCKKFPTVGYCTDAQDHLHGAISAPFPRCTNTSAGVAKLTPKLDDVEYVGLGL